MILWKSCCYCLTSITVSFWVTTMRPSMLLIARRRSGRCESCCACGGCGQLPTPALGTPTACTAHSVATRMTLSPQNGWSPAGQPGELQSRVRSRPSLGAPSFRCLVWQFVHAPIRAQTTLPVGSRWLPHPVAKLCTSSSPRPLSESGLGSRTTDILGLVSMSATWPGCPHQTVRSTSLRAWPASCSRWATSST